MIHGGTRWMKVGWLVERRESVRFDSKIKLGDSKRTGDQDQRNPERKVKAGRTTRTREQ